MLVSSVAEVISIGALLPFLSVLTAPDRIFAHPLIQPVIQQLGIDTSDSLLLVFTVVFCCSAIFAAAVRFALLWAQTKLSFATGADLSIDIYRRTLYQPYAAHIARNSSEIIAGISQKANGVVSRTLLPFTTILGGIFMATAILMALFAIQPLISTLAFIGLGMIYLIVVFLTKRHLALNGERASREMNQVIKALNEGLGGIRDVLIDGTQATYCKIYRNADLPLRQAMANNEIIGSSPRYGVEALGMVLIAVLAYSIAQTNRGIADAVPVLGALALGAQRLLPVLQQAYSSWASMRGGQANLLDTLGLLAQPLPEYSQFKSIEPLPFENKIELMGISFAYGENTPQILKDINLRIPKGSRVGIIGPTGSGKSTLIDIVMALLYPTEGRLMVDGMNVTTTNHRSWQRHIAHVPQAIFLSDASIAENIAFGIESDEIDFNQVRAAAERAQIAGTIESWDLKYDTVVGERGIRMSGGQRQRIGIARALYKKADVIVLDEATSALDNETEIAVMDSIDCIGNDVTIIVIAHRLTTLKGCDTIVRLVDGTISAVGSYEDMIHKEH